MLDNLNFSVIMGIVFFIIGIVGFIFSIFSFNPSIYDESLMYAARFDSFISGVNLLLIGAAIGTLFIVLGKIQAALESISNK